MIKPTIGRVVLVWRGSSPQFEPALITYVHSDSCINVGGFDLNGKPFSMTSLTLRQDDQGDALSHNPDQPPFACWMPYQQQQALQQRQQALQR